MASKLLIPTGIRQRRIEGSRPASSGTAHAGTDIPQAANDEDLAMQRKLLNEANHDAMVVVEYVDKNLGIAEAREVDSGRPVSLTSGRTDGLSIEHLRVGAKLLARITRFQHATAVETVPR